MKNIRLSKCSVNQNEIDAVKKTLKSNFLGMGPKVYEFEKKIKKLLNRNAVCVSTGTAALHIALETLNLKKGDEVILTSLNYIAALQAVTAANLKPVFCDVDLKNLSMCISDLKKKISKRTKVIMPTLYSGDPGNLEEIYEIAKKKKLRVIEDAAHAFGSYRNKKLIGSQGDITCFSFDGIKNITSGEGGCIISNDKRVLNLSKEIRFLSIKKESESRYQKKKQFLFDVVRQGWRYHMSDIMASIGLSQLKKINKFRTRRQQIANRYVNYFQKKKNLELLEINYNLICPHIFVIKLKEKFNRLKLNNWFKKNNIEIGYHWKPLHELTFYKQNFKKTYLPNTEFIKNRILTLPIHFDLKDHEVDVVCKKVIQYLNETHR